MRSFNSLRRNLVSSADIAPSGGQAALANTLEPRPSQRDLDDARARILSTCILAAHHNLSTVFVNRISRQIVQTFAADIVDEMMTGVQDSIFSNGRLRAAVARCILLSGVAFLDVFMILFLRCAKVFVFSSVSRICNSLTISQRNSKHATEHHRRWG